MLRTNHIGQDMGYAPLEGSHGKGGQMKERESSSFSFGWPDYPIKIKFSRQKMQRETPTRKC